MVDTTPYFTPKDILTVVVRFVNNKGKSVETLFEVRDFVDKTGKRMASEILEILHTNIFELQNLVSII